MNDDVHVCIIVLMNSMMVKDLVVKYASNETRGTLFRPADDQASMIQWQSDPLSFQLRPGHGFGLLGTNGSGKTSFLKAIAGLIQPASGEVQIPSKTVSILDLNLGFHPDFSGMENLLMMNACYGRPDHELLDVEPNIAAFSGLGGYLHRPVREYSAGMRMRLGMAWALEQPFDLMIMDELLSVGDMAFQRQCLARIRKRMEEGASLILATHNLQEIALLCQEAVALENGTILAQGTPDSVLGTYLRQSEEAGIFASTRVVRPKDAGEALRTTAESRCELLGVRLTDWFLDDCEDFSTGDGMCVEVHLRVHADEVLPNPLLRVHMQRNDGLMVAGCNNYRSQTHLDLHPGEATLRCRIPRIAFLEGTYYLHVSLWPDEFETLVLDEAYCSTDSPAEFRVSSRRQDGSGVAETQASFEVVGPTE